MESKALPPLSSDVLADTRCRRYASVISVNNTFSSGNATCGADVFIQSSPELGLNTAPATFVAYSQTSPSCSALNVKSGHNSTVNNAKDVTLPTTCDSHYGAASVVYACSSK